MRVHPRESVAMKCASYAQTPVAMDRRESMSNPVLNLAPRHHFCRRPTIHVGLIEYDVGSHVCWPRGQHLLLAHDKIGSVKGRQLKAVPVRNRIRGTRLDTISTENAAVVVDIVNLGVTLGATDPI